MTKTKIWHLIEQKARESKKKNPSWPDHPAGQAGMVCKESGVLMTSCMNYKYDRSKDKVLQAVQVEEMKTNAINTVVAALRFLENIK